MERPEERNQRLRTDLDALLAWKSDYAGNDTQQGAIDVVITTNEINHRHGTGILVKRILNHGQRKLFSIRFHDHWGEPQFGDWNIRLPEIGANRAEAFRSALRLFSGRKVRKVLCVPFHANEPMASIAIHEVFGARLCSYVMDDQNIAGDYIPDELMREFLERSSLRLATHPELRAAYEKKYSLPFFLLPFVAPDALIPRGVMAVAGAERGGALLGSFWDQSWFDRMCAALEPSGCPIDWFGNHHSPFLKFSEEQLRRARITPRGILSEDILAAKLREYPFVIVPTGALDNVESNFSVASLSLPGRIPFAAAVSQTPMLLVGSEKTCGAQFVKHFGIGEVVPYDSPALQAAMKRLRDPSVQLGMRRNAAKMGLAFSDRGIVEWLDASIALGRPVDSRFEDAFAGYHAPAR